MNEDKFEEVREWDALALAELLYDIYIEKKQREASND